jgi:hypothetical protein
MPAPDQPDDTSQSFAGITPDFAADILARMQAHMASRGLDAAMLTPLETEAVQMNVVFEALKLAGFSEVNAMRYLAWRQV